MRVIDADAIQYDQLLKTGNKEHPLEWAASQSSINSMPTIKAEPQHGHWTLIDKGHNFYDWKCSICGGSGRGDYAFCPWCGAVMDEDIPMEYFENGGI